jgi:hypothetical protein
MNLDFENLKKCIRTLDSSLKLLELSPPVRTGPMWAGLGETLGWR